MNAVIKTSTISDGNMYNRNDHEDASVIENRTHFLEKMGTSIDKTIRLRVNYDGDDFCRYIEVDADFAGKGMRNSDVTIADAIVTTAPNIALFLPIADCIGAAIYDPEHGVVAIAHLGRHSLEQYGGTKIITHLTKQYHSNPSALQVWLTPAPSKESYPIFKLDNKGMKEAAHEQLLTAGILSENITDNTAETDKDPNYYSYSEFLKGNTTEDGDHAIVAVMLDSSVTN